MYCHRIIGIIDDKSGCRSVWFFHIFALQIINFKLFGVAPFGVVACKPRRLLKGTVRQLFAAGLYNDMGAGNALGMKPPVPAVGDLEGQFLVLQIVFSDINVKAVAAEIVEGLAFL